MVLKCIKKIIGLGGVNPIATPSTHSNPDVISNQRILDELVAHFTEDLEFESFGDKLLYPMSFNILMTPEDYEDRRLALPILVPVVVSHFYKVIDKRRKDYPNYTPPATYWHFQFSSCAVREIPTDSGAVLNLKPGHIATLAALYKLEIKDTNNISVESNTRVSLKLDQSVVGRDTNANIEALRNLDILGEGTFSVKFDMSLNANPADINIESGAAGVTLATLSYDNMGKHYTFAMQDQLIHISGRNDERTGRSCFRLESDTIKNSHVQIKYMSGENRFKIAAFGYARMNGGEIPLSVGGNIQWMDLANNSTIFINNEIQLRFIIKS
jgi:hypothetical protein